MAKLKKSPGVTVQEVDGNISIPVDKNNNGVDDSLEFPPSDAEDSYLSQSEMVPNARYCSEVLNSLIYKLHHNQLTTSEINKLRAQLENSVSIR